MKQLLERFFGRKDSEGGKRPSKKTGYMIILGIAGLFLLILSNIFSSSPPEAINDQELEKMETAKETSQQETPTTTSIDELESLYKKDLETMLNKIEGVSEAEVMVNLESTSVKVYEKNLIKGQQSTDESDKNGGERKVEDQTEEVQTVLVRQGDREVPLLIQTKKPQVRGVFVVAKGADHATVKKWMIESISRVLDVPKHRVSVMPKN